MAKLARTPGQQQELTEGEAAADQFAAQLVKSLSLPAKDGLLIFKELEQRQLRRAKKKPNTNERSIGGED
jgi:hypothetical protein